VLGLRRSDDLDAVLERAAIQGDDALARLDDGS